MNEFHGASLSLSLSLSLSGLVALFWVGVTVPTNIDMSFVFLSWETVSLANSGTAPNPIRWDL